jgi:hypothetical protein
VDAAAENPGAEVRREGENRFKIRDLFADERCTRAILDFLRTTKVGRWVEQDRVEKNENPEREEEGDEEEEEEGDEDPGQQEEEQ